LTSNFLPPSAPIGTGDSILQHFRKVRNDCIKLFVLTQQVKSEKANREPRRVNFEHIATALWNNKGEDNEILRCHSERIGVYRQ
jgi:uncharacterized membrane protein